MVFVVPKFATTFDRLRDANELPKSTTVLLAVSNGMRNYWFIYLGVLIVTIVLLRRWMLTPSGSRTWDSIKLKIPQAGSIFGNLAVGRFCRVLGTLLGNGVPMLRSLQISRHAIGNEVLAEVVDQAAENVSEGKTCLLYTSPSPRDATLSRMPSSA